MQLLQHKGDITIEQATAIAGAEISFTVPVGEIWKFISLVVVLVADGNAANRTVKLTFSDGTNIFAFAGPNFNQTAGVTYTYSFSEGVVPGVQSITQAQVPTPPNIYLSEGYKIATSTGAIQVGDDFGTATLCIEKWQVAGAT